MREVRIAGTDRIVVTRLRLADTHWTRMRGLLGTAALAEGEGLWIVPCRQIHMYGMRYPVDALFLDEEHRVVAVLENFEPNRVSPKVREAHSVIELRAGAVADSGLSTGIRLVIEGQGGDEIGWVDRAGSLLVNLLMATFFAFFAVQHFRFAQRTGYWATTLPLVIQEGMLVALFLTRRRSVATSPRPLDWVVGIAGTFLPLLFRATDEVSSLRALGAAMQICGLGIAILGLTALGRSVGVVAGNRGVKLQGMYRTVRHPMYTGYMLSYFGYVSAYPSLRNAVIISVTFAALFIRAAVEERFLRQDPAYEAYLGRTRWRFLPYVY
jgi:protein-S-isoprenylcysteine O-methyltransferase Ste14/uncharacterized membrane protein (UPF0127 family)